MIVSMLRPNGTPRGRYPATSAVRAGRASRIGGGAQDRTSRAMASEASRTFSVAPSPPSATASVTQ